MTDSRGCEHEGTKVETASNRLNGVADPEGAIDPLGLLDVIKSVVTSRCDGNQELERP